MARFYLLLLILCIPPCLPTGVGAEEDVGNAPVATTLRERVARWLVDLKDDSFRVREAARAGLKKEGLGARDLLEAASVDPDAEVRRTAEAILAQLPGAVRRPAAEVRPGAFGKLGLLSLNLQGVSVQKAFQVLGAQMSGHFRLPPMNAEAQVTLQVAERPCWAALDELLAAATLTMPDPFDAHGSSRLQPSTAGDPVVPHASMGPVRVRVQEVSATRVFGRSAVARYLVKLRLDWAPFVQLVQYESPRIESAFDPAGRSFLPTPSMNRTTRRGVSTRVRSTTVDLLLMAGKEGVQPVLAVLEFSLPVRLRYDAAEVRLDDTSRIPVALHTSGELAGRGRDESVVFHSFLESKQRQREWIAEYSAHLKSAVSQRTVEAYLLEPDGRRTQLYVAGGRSRSADGTVRITARAYRSKTEKPKGLVVRWFRREDAGTLRFRLEDIPLR